MLNENQQKAVEHLKGPMIVLAGPGSGKTTVVVHRIQNLIENYAVPASKILVITFTKAAAAEMEKRFKSMDIWTNGKVNFGTFHSLFFRILRDAYNYTLEQIINDDEKWSVLKNIVRELQFETNDEDEYIKSFLTELSIMKNELIDIRTYHTKNFPESEFYQIAKKYDAYKQRAEKIDFDDMLTQCYTLLKTEPLVLQKWRNRFSYIMVDEFQDINYVQYECVKLLASPQNNLFVVGDDDQSIYHFRGARPDFLLNFSKEFEHTKTVILDINYRSTESIIRLGEAVISKNKNRFSKNMTGIGEQGSPTTFFSEEDTQKEAARIAKKIFLLSKKGIEYGKIAVIFRTNVQASSYTRIFMNMGISYYLKDSVANIYEHWIAKDILAYLLLAQDESDNTSFLRIINKPKRYISKDVLAQTAKKEGSYLKNIGDSPSFAPWQFRYLSDLRQHLRQIKRRNVFEAVQYVRNVVSYDDYLKEYASFRRMNLSALKEIADEIVQTAKDINTVEEYKEKIEELSEKIKQSNKKGAPPPENAVTLITMHSAKGLEFDAVFIPSIVEGLIPHEKSKTLQEIEEERRLFYVAITRAKTYLCLSETKKRYEKNTKQSLFLKELGLKRKN